MNNSSSNQQPRATTKGRAVVSLILGIVSVIVSLGLMSRETLMFSMPPKILKPMGKIFAKIFFRIGVPEFFIGLISFLTSIVGLIFGKKGITSAAKGLAIVGIMLSTIGLLGSVYVFLTWFGFAVAR